MSLKHVITRGYGNGTFAADVGCIVTRGYQCDVTVDETQLGYFTEDWDAFSAGPIAHQAFLPGSIDYDAFLPGSRAHESFLPGSVDWDLFTPGGVL